MSNERYMNPFNDVSFKRIFGREENKSLLIDFLNNLLVFFIQLPLFNKTEEQCENFLDKWFYVLMNMDVLANLPKSFQCEAFKKLKTVSDTYSLTPEERINYNKAQKDYWDLLEALDGAEDRGVKRGMKIGMEKGAKENSYQIAKSMKAEGLPIEMIKRITGLSIKEIENM